MGVQDNVIQRRRDFLQTSIEHARELINEYRVRLVLSTDVSERFTTGKRIEILEGIVSKYLVELNHFDSPEIAYRNGSIEKIKFSTDERMMLRLLAESNPLSSESPAGSSLQVFLCHSSADKDLVRKLYSQLKMENNIIPWLDEEEILPGEDWDLEIRRAVEKSDAVIVFLSNNLITKEGYIQKEIKFVLDVADEKPEGAIFVIPLKLEVCDIPNRLSRWQWLNYYDENSYEKLLKSLRKRAQTLMKIKNDENQ